MRHVRYCRKKVGQPLRSRKRSCARCSTSKTHCDCAYPSCSRCLEKKLVCLYQNDETIPAALTRKDRSKSTRQGVHTTPLSSDRSGSLDFTSDGSLLQYYGESPTSGLEGFDTATSHQLASLPHPLVSDDLSLRPVSSKHAHSKGLASSSLFRYEENILPENFLFNESRWALDFSNVPLLAHSPVLRAPRAFSPKRQRYPKVSLTRKYVICTIKAYPQMLLTGKELPPFIHTELQSSSTSVGLTTIRNPSTDPLAICLSITAMWTVKNTHNTAFIWRSIRSEQERLFEECFTFDDHNAVAALQAICIYFLLRLSEADEDATNFDIPLISTMTGLSVKYNKSPTWEGWLLAESLRRTIFLLLIISLLFDLSPGTQQNCCDGARLLTEMGLPCHKNIWKAQTQNEWEWEYTAQYASKYQRLTFGDLLQHGKEEGSAGNVLDDWLANVDDFGNVIVAVVSLLEVDGYTMA
ncbi:C6 finger domain-containing protein [Rutstroemia sp. NJR-2017a BBW]|nr:C6 finger domain-containing protein [Rutstroemia sp. NJR-2017a BBW]